MSSKSKKKVFCKSGKTVHSPPSTNELPSSCAKCTRPDSAEQMVQCDICDGWYHFCCVGVDQSIENRDWECEKCAPASSAPAWRVSNPNLNTVLRTDTEASPHLQQGELTHAQPLVAPPHTSQTQSIAAQQNSQKQALAPPQTSQSQAQPPHSFTGASQAQVPQLHIKTQHKAQSVSSSQITESSCKSVKLQLQRLEEERELQEKRDREFLDRKYEILEQMDSSSRGKNGSIVLNASQERVEKWMSDGHVASQMGRPNPTLHDLAFPNQINQDSFKANNICLNKPGPYENRHQSGHSLKMPGLSQLQLAARHAMPRDLPNFNGNPEDWPLFISCYENSTRLCGYSSDENLSRLRHCLKGKALEAVRFKLLYPEHVQSIMETLRTLYGRPDIIINSLLSKIRSEPPPRADRLDTLVSFSFAVQNICAIMESNSLRAHLENPCLMQELVERLPAHIRLSWGVYKQQQGEVNLSTLSAWLHLMAQAAVEVSPPSNYVAEKKNEKRLPAIKGYVNAHQMVQASPGSDPARECKVCSGKCSAIEHCATFKNLDLNDKWNTIKKYNLCRTCLRYHGKSRCNSNKKCGQEGCTYRHHKLLHKSINNREPEAHGQATISKSQGNSEAVVNVHSLRNDSILFRILPVTLYNGTTRCDAYAFFDDGSSVTLIHEELAQLLGLNGDVYPLYLKWTSDEHHREEMSKKVNLQISGIGKSKKFDLLNVRTTKSLDLPLQSVDANKIKTIYRHLKEIPITSYIEGRPMLLIGMDNWHLGVPLRIHKGKGNQLGATKTRLGWVVQGADSTTKPIKSDSYNCHICECQTYSDEKLHRLVKESFMMENANGRSTKTMMSVVDEKAKQMLEMHAHREGNHFVVPLLWKHDKIVFPDSRPMAERRMMCLEAKMAKDLALAEKLQLQIDKYLEKGYIRKLSNREKNEIGPKTWYLPIFPVTNPNKPNKTRIVWDAAARVDGISLNSALLSGPDVLPSLVGILYKFRQGKVAVCADLREMFHQVRITKDDQDSQRFLWRNPTTKDVEEYAMKVMTFGSTCSPYCAQFVKNKNANEFKDQFPKAAKAIIKNHYVDDYLDSFDSEEEATEIAKAVKYIHAQAGFDIHNFISNSEKVLTMLNAEIENDLRKHFETWNGVNEPEKILGMWWSPFEDTFSFRFRAYKLKPGVLSGEVCPTKREVLRALMSIFDPLGLIANILIKPKILLREIWRSSIQWDDEINAKHFEEWREWVGYLAVAEKIIIPRPYSTLSLFDGNTKIQLHIFVDASDNAYAAAAYLRLSSGLYVESSLVGAKTKVGPLKDLSVPKLELEAAVLGVRLCKSICADHSVHIENRIFWSDSKTVLYWIRSEQRRYKHFVAFRVGEILEETDVKNWRWVPSKENVADEATKWKSGCKFEPDSRWYKGPAFLYEKENQWPVDESLSYTTTEEARVHIVREVKGKISIIDYNRFSKWSKLVRALAHVFMLIDFVKKARPKEQNIRLTAENIESAQNYLLRQCQLESFPDLIATPSGSKIAPDVMGELDKGHVLFKLSPYIDENNILRLCGRIDKATDIRHETARPVILPKQHYITELIVRSFHQKYRHQYNETVVNEIRQSFYIPGLRALVKKVCRTCQKCKNLRAKPKPPMMGELPPGRLKSFTRPFSFIGIDYFGPINVRVGRHTEKRWGVLITCLTVRAIHIEIAHSLSTDSCILALKRFISRRGTPLEINSDNGTNFRGASQELKDAVDNLDCGRIANEFVGAELKWKFLPPAAPHMGGSWERMVRSVKQVLADMPLSRNPTDELLLTMMAEVESIINSRPLTYVPLDDDNDEALTPNHFLLGSSSGAKNLSEASDDGIVLKRNWRTAEQFSNAFWKRWIREYLPTLTRRAKWHVPATPLARGDVVILVDPNNPRNHWPRGIISEVFSGKDGQVRSAAVQTSTGIYHRPATKIAKLDVLRQAAEKVVTRTDDPAYQGELLASLATPNQKLN